MIAAAMTTRNNSVPQYADLAKSEAVIDRQVPAQNCQRLVDCAINLQDIRARLSFAVDDRGRVAVAGKAETVLGLACQRCTEPVQVEVKAQIEAVLANSEDQAKLWREQDQALEIIVVSGPQLDVVELIEDEILLHLPAKVCMVAERVNYPKMSFGPLVEEVEPDTHRPFAALSQMGIGARSPESEDDNQ